MFIRTLPSVVSRSHRCFWTSSLSGSADSIRRPSAAEIYIKKKERQKNMQAKVASRPSAASLIDSRDISRAAKQSPVPTLANHDNTASLRPLSTHIPQKNTITENRSVPKWMQIQRRKKLLQAFRSSDPVVVWDLFPTAKKDLWTFDQMIAVMAKHGLINKAFKLYQSMKKAAVKPGSATFLWLLIACSKATIGSGADYVPRCYYVFDEMHKFNIPCTIQHYNFAIQTCANMDDAARANDVLAILLQQGLKPDINTYTSLLKAHSTDIGNVIEVWKKMKDQFDLDIRSYNTMLTVLKDSSNPLLCLRVYREMQAGPVIPDKHSISIVLDATLNAQQPKEAGAIMNEAISSPMVDNITFDTHLCNKLLSVAARLRYSDKVDKIVALMKSRAIPYDNASFEALIMAYGKTGRLNEAFETFSQMKNSHPTAVSVRAYTALLIACRESRAFSRAKDVKEDMELNKIVPDDVFLRTYLSMQTAAH